MQKKIFLSCSSRDQEIALTICRALEARGHPCWMSSRDVMPGENFQGAIVRAIRGAGVMVMVFSANANNSDEIKKEIALAGQTKLMVIPVRVEDVTPSEDFSYELATRQWVDLFRNWEFALDQLGRQIDYVIPKEAPEPAPPVAAPQPPQARAPESVPQKQASESVVSAAPVRTGFIPRNRKPLTIAAGLLLLVGAGVAGFVFLKSDAPPATRTASAAPPVKATLLPVSQKAAGSDAAPAKTTPAPEAVGEQAQPALNPLVQKAVDAARAAEKRARAAQAKAQATARRAEAAAKQAEAGAAGYGVRAGHTGDGSDWQWKGQVAADSWPSGVGLFTITSGGSKGTRYAGEIKNHARNGSGVQTSMLASRQFYHYEGEWQDDDQQGPGVMTFSTYQDAGQWDKRSMVSGVQKQNSDMGMNPDGTSWTGITFRYGNFKTSNLDGYGAKYDARGHLLEQGIFEKGQLKTALTAVSSKAAAITSSGKAPLVSQKAADAARAAEKQARVAQAKARVVAQQAEAAAKQAEAGAAGYGTLTGHEGNSDWRWEGQVANDRPEGLGVHSFTNGSFKDMRYAGEMRNGFQEGVGIQTSPGTRYEGEWQDGFENGAGVMTLTKFEDEQAGQWVKGDMVSGYENGQLKTALAGK